MWARKEGLALEKELAAAAGSGLRIVGPNCLGVYSPAGQLTILPGADYPRTPGRVSFFAQSGGMTEDFCGLAQDYGFHINHAISYGNACDINETDLARYFLADDKTEIVAAYIEGIKSGHVFFDVVRELAAVKPTVILKGGLTPTGSRAAASHTGSLAGSDTAWTAFYKQTGALQAYSMEELLDTIAAFHHLPRSGDDRVAFICGGGGVGVGASDACFRAGLTLASFDHATHEKLAAILPPSGASPHNPVDCDNPFPRPAMLEAIMTAIAESGHAGNIIIDKITMSVGLRQLLGYDKQVGWVDEEWLEEIPVRIRRKFDIGVSVVLREGGEPLDHVSCEAERRRLRKYYQENQVAVYPTVQRALDALAKVAGFYQRRENRYAA